MKPWFTFLTRRIVGASPARRFKASLPVAFRARALALLCATSVAAHAQQTVVGNYNTGSLTVVDLSSGNRVVLAKGAAWPGSAIAPLNSTARESNGNILVGEGGNPARIIRIDRTTGVRTVLSCSKQGSVVGTGPELKNVYGLAIANETTIFASVFFGNAIYRIDLTTGNRTVVTSGDETTNISPHGLLVDTDGSLVFVTGSGGSKMFRVNASSGARTVISSLGSSMEPTVGTGPNLHFPVSVLRLSDGTFAVLNREGDEYILKVDPSTGNRTLISGINRGTGPALGSLRNTMGMDTSGNLYVANFYANSITKIDPATGDRTIVSSESVGAGPGFSGPAALLAGTVARIFEAPAVSAISPSSGSSVGSTTVKIMGMNFTGATAVKFGASAATGFTVDSDSQITATAPAGVVGSTVDVQVTTANGTSAINTEDQFAFVSLAPAVANLNGDSVTFTEDGSAVLLDTGSNATVTDTDSANFSGGNVTVSIATNRVSGEDVLSIRNQGTGAGQIGVSGGDVTYAGTTIGTFTGGSGTSDLVVTLNANATPTNVGALIQNLTYHNTNSGTPSTSARTVRVTVNDGAGGTSTAADVTVTVTAVNDAPTNVGLSSLTLNQSTGIKGLVGTLSATDVDDTTFTFTLVAGTGDTDNASFIISGTSLSASNAGTLTAGTHAVRVQADDGHGGTFANSFTITVVDDVAPAKPAAPDLDPVSDTGVFPTDNNTTVTTPTFTGTAEAGSIVTLYDTDGTTVLGTAPATGGSWSITSSVLAKGSHIVTVKAKDAANNVSAASDGLTVTIDTTAPAVNSVGVPADGTYRVGQNLDFTVNWNEAVDVDTTGGTPSIPVTVGTTTRQAVYIAGGTTTELVFRYTAQNGDIDTDGVTIGALTLNGGAITDAAGNAATLTLNGIGLTTAVRVDAEAPTVTGRTVPTDGTYKVGAQLEFTVTYSENVTVTGTPAIAVTLATGGTVNADCTGGTGTPTLTFRYQVVAGNLDADGIEADSAITLNGGTIKDAVGNDAQTTALGFGVTSGVRVDGVAPTVLSIDRQTPASERTKATSVTYRVTFSEPVTGVDLTDFTLNKTGTANGAVASVAGVAGSETTVYDVVVNTVSGNGTLRLDLNAAGTGIADTATNAIATGYTAGETYTIDTTAPTLSTIARQTPATVHTDAASVTWQVTFGEGVTGVDAADFTATVVSGAGNGTVAAVTPVSPSVYDVVVNLTGQARLRLGLKSTGTGIADLAGNALADGGFAKGEFYLAGITSVFDTSAVAPSGFVIVAGGGTKLAQRFTTAAGQPLTLSSVAALLNGVTGTPSPVVRIMADNAGVPGATVVATLTNPASLTANALNVWTGPVLLNASTTYWIVFSDTSASASYEVRLSTAATSGGTGTWLTSPTDYKFYYGASLENSVNGIVKLALGATSTPTITSGLTASGTYGTAFAGYTITGTNTPTSFGATGLPTGLSLNAATGEISGTPTQAGTFNVTLTGTNGSGPGPSSTLVLTIAKAPLTVTANNASRYVGYANPRFAVSYSGFRNGDTAASLTAAPTASTTATVASPVGTYPITPAGGASGNYDFSYVNGTLTVSVEPPPAKNSQMITFAPLGAAVVGDTVALSASASSGLSVSFSLVSGPATLSGSTVTCTGIGLVTVRATQPGNGVYNAATPVEQSFTVGLPTPTVTTPTQVPAPLPGGAATLAVPTPLANATYRWQRNGADLTGATSPTLALANVQPPAAGLYTYTVQTPGGASATSAPVIVGVATTEKVEGTGEQVGADIQHPNGNVYDQLLLEGAGASFTADVGQVTRMSFVDLSDDIVQVEFSGAGTLSLVMDNAPAGAPAANYNQPGVNYVRGHVGIVITGADETTNVSVFSVGRITAVNQTLFRDNVAYDGVANVAFIAIQSTNGRFGGVRTGNVEYYAQTGFTGLYAPGVAFTGPVNVGDIQAFDAAQPVLVVGTASNVRIAGGNLAQPNGRPINVDGLTRVTMAPGQTSQGNALPVQTNQGLLQQAGVDVTDLIVAGP